MSKAVLVINMPESCSKCQFSYEFQGIKKCQLMNVLYKGASMLSQNSFTARRHEKCPLRQLPCEQVYYIVDKGTKYATVMSCSITDLRLYEIKGIDKAGYYWSTKERAEEALIAEKVRK